jgi:hypothetical protein
MEESSTAVSVYEVTPFRSQNLITLELSICGSSLRIYGASTIIDFGHFINQKASMLLSLPPLSLFLIGDMAFVFLGACSLADCYLSLRSILVVRFQV